MKADVERALPSSKRFKLTKTNVDTRCLPPTPGATNGRGNPLLQAIYFDTEIPGFGLRVGRTCKTYILQRDIHGKTIKVRIGRHGPWTPQQARQRALELIVEMDSGVNPNQRKRQRASEGVTLREAVDAHATGMENKGRKPRSIAAFRRETERYLGDWMDRPLAEITPDECATRHKRISTQGRSIANRVLGHLRAAYNGARRRHRTLPENPVNGVDMNATRRRQEPIPWVELPAWYAAVLGLPNPVRRDLQLFTLLTGLRREDAATVRWENVDLDAGTLYLPTPKGGETRAFTIPLSERAVRILCGRRRENAVLFGPYGGDGGWAFPTRSAKQGVTHVKEPKEQRRGLPSPHRLRDTYATACHEAGISMLDMKVLMNHRYGSGDVTAGYIRQNVEHLRSCQESVTNFLWAKLEPEADNRVAALRRA